MNSPITLAFTVILIAVGSILFTYRVLYMLVRMQPWNNPPTTLAWSWSVGPAGLAILLVVLCTPGCGNKCAREDGATTLSLLLGGFILGIPVLSWCFFYSIPDLARDLPPDLPRGGLDILCLAVGFSLLMADLLLGDCPASCT